MNRLYRDLILSKVKTAIDNAKAVSPMSHQGLKGQLREILVRDLFKPLLPPGFGLGTGEIITVDDRQSKQQDVVLFDKNILPPILFEGTSGLFPIESVLYSIEIKSKLTAQEIKDSHANAAELQKLNYQSGCYDALGQPLPHTFERLIPALFAFDTDLSCDGKNDIERYDEIRGSDQPALVVLCVVGRGYWYWKDDQWVAWKRDYEFTEVVGFIAGVMNTYRRIASTRNQPRLGNYLC